MAETFQPGSPSAGAAFRLTNILVPTDFSPESLKALTYASAFARQFDAVLWLLHVQEPIPASTGGFEAVPIVIDDPRITKNLEERLARFAGENVPSGIAFRTEIRVGAAFEEIAAVARARSIDLIVATTHGHTGLARVLLGSTAERLVQRAPCPILIVRQREHEFLGQELAISKLKKVLAPVDFSECSRKALHYAAAFAARFGAQILPLHTIEIPYGTGEAGIVLETEVFRKRMHEEAQRHMADFAQEHAGVLLDAGAIRTGTPYREIIKAAEECAIDLIVLGTHGRSGLKHFLIGSTAERVVRHAPCPVLVVREREREFIEPA